jgi:protoheme IX farnesyltransferase
METTLPAAPRSVLDVLRDYLQLTKLRIMLLLLFTMVTAMVIAAGGIPDLLILIPALLGGALASGGSSAINQYLDRDMDAKMSRTSRRPIPAGRIVPLNALIFGLALVAWSVLILGLFVNWLTALLALIGSVYYVLVYTALLKRNTVLNILIGGGAGAFPVLVGWSAVTGVLGVEAFLLFAIVFYWTPPHSWALALLVNSDYAKAEVPMMPVARGEETTRVQILLYSIQLLIISLLPALFGVLGAIYLIAAALLGAGMIRAAINLLRAADKAMARRVYKYSTAYLAFLFLAMIVDRLVQQIMHSLQ